MELGAGNGKLAKPLVERGLDVVPIDISWNALQQLGFGVLADAANLPFAPRSFSAILDIHCLQHLRKADRGQALRNIFELADPGAIFICEAFGELDMRANGGTGVPHEQNMRVLQDGRETVYRTLEALVGELQAVGFEILAKSEKKQELSHDGAKYQRHYLQVHARRPPQNP